MNDSMKEKRAHTTIERSLRKENFMKDLVPEADVVDLSEKPEENKRKRKRKVILDREVNKARR